MQSDDPKELLFRARGILLTLAPFWGFLLTECDVALSESYPTAWQTYGRGGEVIIRLNPEFIKTLKLPQIAAVLVHELRHALHLHILRRGGRDPLLFNIAGDCVVNSDPFIAANGAGGMVTIGDLDIDPAVKQTLEEQSRQGGLVAEEVYDAIMKGCKAPKKGGGKGDGAGTKEKYGPGGSKDFSKQRDLPDDADGVGTVEEEAIKQRLREQINQAATTCIGNLPGDLNNLIKQLAPPQVAWPRQIRDWSSSVLGLGRVRSYRRPPRVPAPYIAPGRARSEGKRLTAFLDTSGSVDDHSIELFFGELESLERYAELWLVIFDAAATKPVVYHHGAWRNTRIPRGGTDVRAAFARLKEMPPVDGVIVLTDGYTPWPEGKQIPRLPVLWCITTEVKAPFGKTVPVKVERNR